MTIEFETHVQNTVQLTLTWVTLRCAKSLRWCVTALAPTASSRRTMNVSSNWSTCSQICTKSGHTSAHLLAYPFRYPFVLTPKSSSAAYSHYTNVKSGWFTVVDSGKQCFAFFRRFFSWDQRALLLQKPGVTQLFRLPLTYFLLFSWD